MPAHVLALPVSASAINLVDGDGEKYPLVLGTDTFNRVGEDGNIPIVPLNGGCEFQGSSLPAEWHKGWDANIDTFTATIDSGTLRLTGVASVAGTAGNGWINSHHPAPLLDGLEYTVSLEVPVDDTGGTASRDIKLAHFIKQDKDELQPDSDNNYLQIEVDVDENGLIMYLRKEVNGVNTTLDSGYDYTMDGTRSTGNLEATIWRLVFNGKPGTPGATLSVYLKQSDTLANAETATENELDGSPYDISDLAFNIAYPSYAVYTENTTYFGTTYDSANRAASTYLRVNYDNSPFKIHYDFTPADYGKTDVSLWDGDPDSGGVRVYDEDHVFANDVYLQNGLIRLEIVDDRAYPMDIYFYNPSDVAWQNPRNRYAWRLDDVGKSMVYGYFRHIVYVSPEKCVIQVRYTDTATHDEDYFMDVNYTLLRGGSYVLAEIVNLYPPNPVEYWVGADSSSRFVYVGDNSIADDDLAISSANTTVTDNFTVGFDPDKNEWLFFTGANTMPGGSDADFRGINGDAYFRHIIAEDVFVHRRITGFSQFSNVSNLFKEAEDATLAGGATVVADAGASGGQAVLLDAINEIVFYSFMAGTNLPAGRYLVVIRARDTNQIANDLGITSHNFTDGESRNEENEGTATNQIPVLTANYEYYSWVFDITSTDATGTDSIRSPLCKKIQAAANEIYIDYFLIIPCGNGYDFPQDLAHSSLRGVTQLPRLCER